MNANSWTKRGLLMASAIGLAMLGGGAASAEEVIVGLITKTNNNPFFVKMKEGAEAKAKELGVELQQLRRQVRRRQRGSGRGDREPDLGRRQGHPDHAQRHQGDRADDQEGARGRHPGDRARHAARPDRRRRRHHGHRQFQGRPADRRSGPPKTLGDKATDAKIAFLDALESQPTTDMLRDQGFMKGFGIDIMDPTRYGEETDPRIVGHQWGKGAEEGGRTGMENLLQKDPDVSVVYTINEPTAAGAYEALKAAGKEGDVLMTSVDGGCPGVKNVQAGVIGATSMQFPLLMASLGVEAVAEFAKSGKKPEPTPGLEFFDTGVALITDKPVDGRALDHLGRRPDQVLGLTRT